MKKKVRELVAWAVDGKRIEGAPEEYAAAWAEAIKRHEWKGLAGQSLLVFDGPSPSLLLGIGGHSSRSSGSYEWRAVYEAGIQAASMARKHRFEKVVLGGIPGAARRLAWRGLHAGRYSYRVGTKKKKSSPISIEVRGLTQRERSRAETVAEAVELARNLVDTPPSEKYPAAFTARVARSLKQAGLKVEIHDEKRLAREDCRGVLAVGCGSDHPPRLVRVEYAPRTAKRHIVLVGKGVTFDSGGLNIKTFEGMKTMKCDMAGAAAVLGAVLAAARLRLAVRVTALVGLAENMPGGNAFKPGDVIRTRSGKTVEILNTDAEGRIILADLLRIAVEVDPDHIVDVATLTGACVVALGDEITGLFANDDRLAERLIAASEREGEIFWRMPIGRDFTGKVKGTISDLKNVGGRSGGACSAAAFLEEFVEKRSWAHLDIAGPSFREGGGAGRPAGGTGAAVAPLVAFLEGFHR